MSLEPTLRIPNSFRLPSVSDVSDPMKANEYSIDELAEYYKNVSLNSNTVFRIDILENLETGNLLENFSALVVSIFTSFGVVHLVLATGDVVALMVTSDDYLSR